MDRSSGVEHASRRVVPEVLLGVVQIVMQGVRFLLGVCILAEAEVHHVDIVKYRRC